MTSAIDPRIGTLVRNGKEVFYLDGNPWGPIEGSIEYLHSILRNDEIELAKKVITESAAGEAEYVASRTTAEPNVDREFFVKCYQTAAFRIEEERKRIARFKEVKRADFAISHKLVRTLLAAGFAITIDNGGDEPEIAKSTDAKAIFKAMQLADEDIVTAYRNGKPFGWVKLIYGESGWDVICDSTTNLEEFIGDGSPVAKTQTYWETRICG